MGLLWERFCASEWKEMTEIRKNIYLIDDQLDHDPGVAHQTALRTLATYLPVGRKMLRRLEESLAS